MGGELLHPVFAAHGDARGDGGADGVAGLHLGGGAEGDLAGVPARLPGGSLNAGANGLNVVLQCLVHTQSVTTFPL